MSELANITTTNVEHPNRRKRFTEYPCSPRQIFSTGFLVHPAPHPPPRYSQISLSQKRLCMHSVISVFRADVAQIVEKQASTSDLSILVKVTNWPFTYSERALARRRTPGRNRTRFSNLPVSGFTICNKKFLLGKQFIPSNHVYGLVRWEISWLVPTSITFEWPPISA